ncbi:DUF397 domain-containing protein [Actinokineospora sp. NBRC 105648]|uniref:DUF397 domain-containing protein n=1 Tax=Actinokineospora sp. NBRC 105648 TaxID=3032206 RepID=UPI0024A2995D|nr:DUF397 domain-containing protein [Actinokineospora sp. NBRC 105648]GLZ42430.1 hypothetical protein Acsp05_60540 [Actinokineospora sp. NBRC 105648]
MSVRFRQSSFCTSGACLQVDFPLGGVVTVRDSKSAVGLTPFANPAHWRTFAAQVASGALVRPQADPR